MEDRQWRLGDDLTQEDNLMDAITFGDIILQAHCNCRNIDRTAVTAEAYLLLSMRIQDMEELLERNIDKICDEARKGRET